MRIALALIVLLVLSVSATAVAQQRVGLPVDSVAFADAQRVDVDASDPYGWVRISFEGDRRVRMDVRVLRDARDARAALQDVVRTTSGELPVLSFADAAFGDARFVAFVRDNIVAIVRSERALGDARVVDAAIRAAPLGVPDLSPIPVDLPQLAIGVPTPIQLGSDVLSVHIVAHGPAVARKTSRGWVVTRTGPGEARLETRACDTLLRRR